MPIDAIYPSPHALKGLLVREVKGYDHPLRLLIKLLSYCMKPFLSCRVPDLHVNLIERITATVTILFFIYLRFFLLRRSSACHCKGMSIFSGDTIDAYCLDVRLLELAVAKPRTLVRPNKFASLLLQNGCLTNRTVT
jgi:hypothetical protein